MVRLELTDNGNGQSDVTEGDGIYSGFLTALPGSPTGSGDGSDETLGTQYTVHVTAINGGAARVPVNVTNPLLGRDYRDRGRKATHIVYSYSDL